jgi:hypothetical protein
MKAENIKVGEYIVFKRTGQRIKVQQDVMQDNCHEAITYLRMRADDYRKPTIADLNKGDVFEYGGKRRLITEPRSGARRIQAQSFEYPFRLLSFGPSTKIRIISLASKKVEPQGHDHAFIIEVDPKTRIPIQHKHQERKTATVWVNIYPRGEMSEPYATKEHAGSEAGPGREACIEVPITWTKGEGLGE